MSTHKLVTIASNFAYLCAGLYGLTVGGPLAVEFLIACAALTAGSSLFHFAISNPNLSRSAMARYDEVGMYWVFSVLIMATLGIHSWIVVAVVWAIVTAAALMDAVDSYPALGGMGLVLLLSLIAQDMWAAVATSIGLFLVAFGARQMDEPLDNGWRHALWHLMSAGLIGYLYQLIA